MAAAVELYILGLIKHKASASIWYTERRARGEYIAAYLNLTLSSVRWFLALCRTSFRQPANGPSPPRTMQTIDLRTGGWWTGLLAAATSHTRRRCRVLFLTQLAARPTATREPRRPSTIDVHRRRFGVGRTPFRHRTRDRPYCVRRLMRIAPEFTFCAPLSDRRPGPGPSTCFVSYLMWSRTVVLAAPPLEKKKSNTPAKTSYMIIFLNSLLHSLASYARFVTWQVFIYLLNFFYFLTCFFLFLNDLIKCYSVLNQLKTRIVIRCNDNFFFTIN